MMRQRGFSLLELAVVVSIVAVLAGALLNRVSFYREQAEQAAVRNIVGVLRSSLHMRSAQLLATGRNTEISKLTMLNPMDLLAQKPANYLGEYFTPQNFNISRGNWYFNRQKFLLVYITGTGATFQGADPKQYKYRIELLKSLDDANGPKPAETFQSKNNEGIALVEVP